ncbi:MAG TPA: LPXTG cell wall anchor domain-containing protein [Candidatus Limnocylindria bacterium]|nr:LPXTG cell wall anchor domain-containing protein [Candidatus Limnocylindria bacterium]
MNWFEQLTGLDPDANTGTFEAMLATVIGLAIIVVAAFAISRRTKTAR